MPDNLTVLTDLIILYFASFIIHKGDLKSNVEYKRCYFLLFRKAISEKLINYSHCCSKFRVN